MSLLNDAITLEFIDRESQTSSFQNAVVNNSGTPEFEFVGNTFTFIDVSDTSFTIDLNGFIPGPSITIFDVTFILSDLDFSTGDITKVTASDGSGIVPTVTPTSITIDIPFGTPNTSTFSFDIECFLSGTNILTDKGEVTVENLQIGDNVVTAEGKLEPVKWIGYQTVQPNQVKNPLRGYPILIKAGALGNNLPQRDLYVSPDHAMFFEGVLINAGALVNGTSIVKTEPKSAFTYYHVELENHALLLAEGASAESYLPQNEDRLAYENGAEYEKLYPYGSNLMLWPMDYPRISSWNKVPRYMRKKLNQIAEELGLVVKAA